MAVDMPTLLAAIQGDQETKVQLKRSWLSEVYRLLVDRECLIKENAKLKEMVRKDWDLRSHQPDPKAWEDMDEGMNKIFGKGSAFGKFFGKGKDF